MHTLNFQLTAWDFLLLVVVSLMGTAMAYVRHPRLKAFILTLPFPFTVACLSLGQGVNATHVLGLFLLLMYNHAVRALHVGCGLPIVPSIALPTLAYAGFGAWVAPRVSNSDPAFWGGSAALFLFALMLYRRTGHRHEPGHRTPLPFWIKLPVVMGVVLLLIISKQALQGFMTMFPMVSIVAAYEARHSLWTISRTVAAFALCLLPMLVVMRLLEPAHGLGPALAAGWLVYLALMIPFTRARWAAERRTEPVPSPA